MAVVQNKKVDFGKRSGLKVYPVSIGAMRLPDEEQAIPLIRQAIDANMIYIDTCYYYDGSEIKVGKSLKDGYREKVILSSKWSPWIRKDPKNEPTADCTYKHLLESLERLDVEYFDFYQVWNINNEDAYNHTTKKGGVLEGILRAMDEGLVKHTGFTTHDSAENVSRYIDEADWCETILFGYNMMTPKYIDTIAKAHEKGIATAVMNPVAGGLLARDSSVFKQTTKETVGIDDPVEAAYRYLMGDENIDTILCGINRPSDITSTIEYCQKTPLTAEHRQTLSEAMYKLSTDSFCTNCNYCMPCPQGINIPAMVAVAWHDRIHKISDLPQEIYEVFMRESNPNRSAEPSECTECGQCEQKCTQKLKIINEMKYVKEKYGKVD